MTKISTLSDQPFSFSPWNRIFGVKNHMFLSQVKILVFLHHLQKEWILFYLKWAWNECLHLRTSKMSIDMGRRIVHWSSKRFPSNWKRWIALWVNSVPWLFRAVCVVQVQNQDKVHLCPKSAPPTFQNHAANVILSHDFRPLMILGTRKRNCAKVIEQQTRSKLGAGRKRV